MPNCCETHLGLEPIHAASAVEAFAVIRDRRPDLILTDIGMPEISGIELTRRLKSIDVLKGIPIIMITGKAIKPRSNKVWTQEPTSSLSSLS